MRHLILFITVLAFVSCQPAEQPSEEAAPETPSEEAAPETPSEEAAPAGESMDSTVVSPDHYKVELDNDHVRVVRITYAAGEETLDMHSHPDGVVVFLADGSVQMELEDETAEERSFKAGDSQWSPAETHRGKALSDIEAILVEIRGSGAEVEIPDTNATVSDPDHHQVEFENDKVRIVRMTYPAGYKTPSHDHLLGVNIMLTDYKAKSAPEGEEGEEASGKAGEVSWVDTAPPHVSENTGEGALSLIRVEIKSEP